jgi:short-subunit dehydrogenase
LQPLFDLWKVMSMTSSAPLDHATIDPRHLLIVGAGPGVGGSIARRFAEDGYHITLLARAPEDVANLAQALVDTGVVVDTLTADAGDPDGLRATLTDLYGRDDAPGLLVYNAAQGAPDSLIGNTVAGLHHAYDVDVVGAVVATQVAAPAMRAAGAGTILFTGGGFADHPVPALATLSLGKAALRSAATILGAELAEDGIRVATVTIAGVVARGTAFDPDRIAETFWSVVQSDGDWQSEFRFEGT